MDDVNMDEDSGTEEHVEITSSTDTSMSSSRSLKKKKEYFVQLGYPIVNTRRGYKK